MHTNEISSTHSGTVRAAAKDRRRNARFPLKLPAQYRAGKTSGWAMTINIGSGGALLNVAGQALKRNDRIELSINWPVLLHQKVHLNLIALGTVLRAEEGSAAVKFEQHHFRTASAASRHEHAADARRPKSH